MFDILINGFIKLMVVIGFIISQLVQIIIGLIFFIFTLPIILYIPFVWFAGLFMREVKDEDSLE